MGSDPYMQLISLSLATSMYTFISYGLQPLILIWRLGGHTQLVSALCGDHYTHSLSCYMSWPLYTHLLSSHRLWRLYALCISLQVKSLLRHFVFICFKWTMSRADLTQQLKYATSCWETWGSPSYCVVISNIHLPFSFINSHNRECTTLYM